MTKITINYSISGRNDPIARTTIGNISYFGYGDSFELAKEDLIQKLRERENLHIPTPEEVEI